ncbi:hypothetical protein C8F01DRAFT_1088868 [Mycena amicta]|nr:hypothetical protein C8F01DRAFT_1088868 [Mycena amicta]
MRLRSTPPAVYARLPHSDLHLHHDSLKPSPLSMHSLKSLEPTDDTEGMGIADAAEGKTDKDMDMEGVGEDDAQTGCMDEEMKVEEMEGVGEDDAQTGCMDEEMEDASEYHQPKRREIPKPIVASRPSKQAGYDAPPGTSGCKICKNLQPERHCYRFLYCEAQDPELLQALNNCALTEASKGDRLESRKDVCLPLLVSLILG